MRAPSYRNVGMATYLKKSRNIAIHRATGLIGVDGRGEVKWGS